MTDVQPAAAGQKQPNSRMCFVCGLENESGLHVKFYTEAPGKVRVDWTAPERYQGYPGHLHGGIAAALLDEAAGRTVLDGDSLRFFVTLKMELRYRKPVPIGVPLVIRGEIVRDRPKCGWRKRRLKSPAAPIWTGSVGACIRTNNKNSNHPGKGGRRSASFPKGIIRGRLANSQVFFRNGSKKDRFPNPQTKPDTVKLHQLMPMMDMA
jgi:acyl-coenzyme A thioesterase PaaI-like protein